LKLIKKNALQQKIYVIWQIVLKMSILAINETCSKLKKKRFKMPNAAYSNRYLQPKETAAIHK
jgi:hypothetical protein